MKRLNFGCGKDIKKGYMNADIIRKNGIDASFDFNRFPYPLKTNTFDSVYSSNVIEHLDNIPRVMKELHRIIKPNGVIRIIVPYYNCYGAYNDVTHKHYFSHKAFEPFYNPAQADYFIKERFMLKSILFTPTRIGAFIPFPPVRLFLSFIFGQLIQTIDITMKVIK